MAIIFDKLFSTMEEKRITKYALRRDKVIGIATLEKMRKNEGNVDTRSINSLCRYMNCQPGDLMEYIPDSD